MKQLVRKVVLSAVITGFSLLFAQSSFAISNISDYLLEPMPSWYNERFTEGHLDINKMVKDGYSRLEAVEIQNQMKDILDNNPVYTQLEKNGKTREMVKNKDKVILQALDQAIHSVKDKKYFESGFVPEPLKDNEFYVGFDLDETLLVQWYKAGQNGPGYYDFKVPVLDHILRPVFSSPDYVSLTPGLEKAFTDIASMPGNKGILLFSAKEDPATQVIIDRIKIKGIPLRKFVKGIFTRNYLVRESEPTKLSKDLRMIDESLKHIIIVDDNPTRLLEPQKPNVREIPQYSPDEYLNAKNKTKDKKVINFFEKMLPVIVDEVRDTENYSLKNNVTFVDAFYPYSTDGSIEWIMLVKQGYSPVEATDYIRKNRNLMKAKFFFYEGEK